MHANCSCIWEIGLVYDIRQGLIFFHFLCVARALSCVGANRKQVGGMPIFPILDVFDHRGFEICASVGCCWHEDGRHRD